MALLTRPQVSQAQVTTGRSVKPPCSTSAAEMWDNVRSALMATRMTAGDTSFALATVSHDRVVEPTTLALLPLSVDSLRRVGIMGTRAENIATYLASDLQLLYSDDFVATHCFRMRNDGTLTSIAFEPRAARRDLADLAGEATLDRSSLALQRLRFIYTNLPLPKAQAGATLTFAHVGGGAWVVTDWRIRVPSIEKSRASARSSGFVVRSFEERSGELAFVVRRADTLWKGAPSLLASVSASARADAAFAASTQKRMPIDNTRGRARIVALPESTALRARLSGRVIGDSLGAPLASAEVSLTDIALTTRTNAQGMFTLTDIPAGEHRLFVRHIGYTQLDTTLAFADGMTRSHAVRLDRVATLDSVRVVEKAFLRTFEENRNRGLGHFLDRAELAKKEGQSFASVMAEMPGARILDGRGSYTWLRSTRGGMTMSGAGLTMGDGNDAIHGAKPGCHPRVYVDRMQVFSGRVGEPLFNLNSITPDRIEALEYYAGVAQVPAMYAGTNDACGVLVIWLRRTFDDPEKPEKP